MRVKEYLSVRGIDYQSINVLEGDGLAVLQALGARSVPVVSRGTEFVFAQVIRDVVEFLGLEDDTQPVLSPAELIDRYDRILGLAIDLVAAMPDDQLQNELPNRPRSWRVLMHHIFQIPVSFLEMEETGETLRHEVMLAPPPEDMRSSADIAAFGAAVHKRFQAWRTGAEDKDFTAQVPTYFGETSRHEMLERTVWHSTQHVRQVASLLEQAGVIVARPLQAADLEGLPLTEKIWDDG